ncbi:MAG: hypothetical protein KDB99_15815 [Chitinophagaceae bacterium]|nr:hypothetical protein [Bdellovibrionales bacterium]MCB0777770.1 hypothetical protein [Chitinophagaceae bacterium]
MEVHHHAHTARKKWTHYFWEFLMLFLAVFCGFLAEYKLEHTIEHQREKKFAKQMLADLRMDSFYFSKHIPLVNDLLQKHQQFYDLMTNRQRPSDKEILNKCYPLLYTLDIQATTATYNQMKTSGGLRYIQDQKLTSALQQYYEVLLPRVVKASDLGINFFEDNVNPFVLKHFRVQDLDVIGDSVKVNSPVIMNRTIQTDQELLNIIENYGSIHKMIIERLTMPAVKKLNELIELLKKEYHLK